LPEVYKAKWILPADGGIVQNGAIVADNGIIIDLLYHQEISGENYTVYDFGNAVITPGFINLHTHLQYTGTANTSPKSLKNKLKKFFLKLRNRFLFWGKSKNSFTFWIVNLITDYICLDGDQKAEAVKTGLDMALKSGTTCVAQLSGEEEFFDIFNNSPLKTYIFLETFSDSKKSTSKAFSELKRKVNNLLQKCGDSTFIGISPHSVYNIHKSYWKKIYDFTRKNKLLINTHFAESTEEMEWIRHGVSNLIILHRFAGIKQLKPFKKESNPVKLIAKTGILNKNTVIAHANQLNDSELKLLSSYKAGLVYCPRSNMILHGKTLDFQAVSEIFGERTGLGTDSLSSNYDLSVFNEAKFIKNNSGQASTALDVLKLLNMLTINSAKMLKLDHKIGCLKNGRDADFLVFQLEDDEYYTDIFNKKCPYRVYIKGKAVIFN
jgi:cytosine/adenosine deaminase-related metal-dependent hydrolase